MKHLNAESLSLSLYWGPNLPELQVLWIISDREEKSSVPLLSLQNVAKRWQYPIHYSFTVPSTFITSLKYYYNQFFACKNVKHFLAMQGYSFYLQGSVYL